MAEAGKSTLDIARILNDEGITSPRGKPWGKTSVHAILINETYTGTLTWGVNAKDGADPVRVAERVSQPSSPRPSSIESASCCGPGRPGSSTPAGLQAPFSSAGW